MTSMEFSHRVVLMRPISGLRLHGAGDRAARSPAPGALPREEPLLPRMETVLGALANLYWLREGGNGCDTWEDCVLRPALTLICGDKWRQASIYGPFLLVQRSEGSARVFVNVSAGLLEAEENALEKYRRAAEENAKPSALPRTIIERQRITKGILQKLRESGRFVPRDRILRRLVSLALAPGKKTASYGLLYSQAWIDPHAVDPHAIATHVVLFVECSGGEATGKEHLAGSLGPRSAPVTVTITGAGEDGVDENQGNSDNAYLVTSNQPLGASLLSNINDNDTKNDIRVVHPLRPPPQLELHASAYASQIEPFAPRKTQPLPALWPGTIVINDSNDNELLELNAINAYTLGKRMVKLRRTIPYTLVIEIAKKLAENAS